MKLETFLMEKGVGYEKHDHPATYTAQQLAAVEHVSGYKVAKPVIVKGRDGYCMCVLPAPEHVDLGLVGQLLGDENLRFATESELGQLFPDCELGAEPPMGCLFGMKTIMDERLKEDDFIIMQSGSHREAVKLRRREWEALCKPTVASIALV